MKRIKGFFKKLIFLGILFVVGVAYANGDFSRMATFLQEFRPSSPIMATSELRSDAARIRVLGLEVQGKDELDVERYALETARMFQESGYSSHALGTLCRTESGRRDFGGTTNCLTLNEDNAVERFNKAREAERIAIAKSNCDRKKGIPLTPWSKKKRREACEKKVIDRLWQ